VQRETKTVGGKLYIAWADFFLVDFKSNIRRENWTNAIHGYVDTYCKLPTRCISDGLQKSSSEQPDQGLVALTMLFYLTNNLVLEAALTNL